ncbi:MAG: hypothetical protein ACFFCW_35110, partial [Candidatus Hodarchaeota archaeon]
MNEHNVFKIEYSVMKGNNPTNDITLEDCVLSIYFPHAELSEQKPLVCFLELSLGNRQAQNETVSLDKYVINLSLPTAKADHDNETRELESVATTIFKSKDNYWDKYSFLWNQQFEFVELKY